MKRSILITSSAALAIVASVVTASADQKPRPDMMSLIPAFEELDLNSDGQISTEELQAQGKIRFDKMDANKDEKLSSEELEAQIVEMTKRMKKAQEKMIKRLDTDGDGYLSAEEMEKAHSRAGKMAKHMMKRLDKNDDEMISKEEFDAMQERFDHRMKRKGHGEHGGKAHDKDHGKGHDNSDT